MGRKRESPSEGERGKGRRTNGKQVTELHRRSLARKCGTKEGGKLGPGERVREKGRKDSRMATW